MCFGVWSRKCELKSFCRLITSALRVLAAQLQLIYAGLSRAMFPTRFFFPFPGRGRWSWVTSCWLSTTSGWRTAPWRRLSRSSSSARSSSNWRSEKMKTTQVVSHCHCGIRRLESRKLLSRSQRERWDKTPSISQEEHLIRLLVGFFTLYYFFRNLPIWPSSNYEIMSVDYLLESQNWARPFAGIFIDWFQGT